MKDSNGLTVLRAKNGLRALYNKGKLVTTFLKSELEHEVEVAIKQQGEFGDRIQDRVVEINEIFDFPATLDEIKDAVDDTITEVKEKVEEVKEETVKKVAKKAEAVKKAIKS